MRQFAPSGGDVYERATRQTADRRAGRPNRRYAPMVGSWVAAIRAGSAAIQRATPVRRNHGGDGSADPGGSGRADPGGSGRNDPGVGGRADPGRRSNTDRLAGDARPLGGSPG